MRQGFAPPPYPYDRLSAIKELASALPGGLVDCSIGTPCDAPMQEIIAALSTSGSERGYPTSAGSDGFRQSAGAWMERRFGVTLAQEQIAACVGTKEFVASTAQFLSLRSPDKDVVLYPEISYPTYAMGATLAGLESYPVPLKNGRLDLESIPEAIAERALLLWSNSPSNPTGSLDDLEATARWGRSQSIPVFSDECYCEFTWDGPPRTILESGCDGVVAVHSLSKRSNLAGVRAGVYAGDGEIVSFLRNVRQHAGLMVAGPVQAAGAMAFDDDEHVMVQRVRYQERLVIMAAALGALGAQAIVPQGSFYLWIPVPASMGDAWEFARSLAEKGGILVTPGDLYGPAGSKHVRLAVVQPTERLELVAQRLASSQEF